MRNLGMKFISLCLVLQYGTNINIQAIVVLCHVVCICKAESFVTCEAFQ